MFVHAQDNNSCQLAKVHAMPTKLGLTRARKAGMKIFKSLLVILMPLALAREHAMRRNSRLPNHPL